MSEPSKVTAFLAAAEGKLGMLSPAQTHALEVAAKKVRLAVESGKPLGDAEWADLFPTEPIRTLARKMLTDVSITDLDFGATLLETASIRNDVASRTMAFAPQAIERRWHALLASIPDDGLPADDGSGIIDGMELGRLILRVRSGHDHVAYARLPSAEGFRQRFIEAARDAGRLALIDGLPVDQR